MAGKSRHTGPGRNKWPRPIRKCESGQIASTCGMETATPLRGAASAIDLALALVTEDLGEAVSAAIAQRMILFPRRSEGSPQVSETPIAQRSSNQVINNLLIWMADHVTGDLSVPSLARRVAMSPRNFARHFLQQTGKTPGRHTSDLRMETAQKLFVSGGWTLEE